MSFWKRIAAWLFLLVCLPLLPVGSARAAEQRPDAPTFRVYATREGLVGRRTANGHVIRPRDRFVALPSWTVLSPKGSDKYQVRVTYKGRSTVLPVWDVGPWNTKDDYWNVKRRYADLPQGVPMAYAARKQGYNNGRDEFGRKIKIHNGIDIADGAFWDDLGMRESDYVEVTFLWMGSDPQPEEPVATAPAQPLTAQPEPVTLPEGGVGVDDGAAGFGVDGNPSLTTVPCGVNGAARATIGTPNAGGQAFWQPALPSAGLYEAMAYIPACGAANATEQARYAVTHDGATTEVTVDQASGGGRWLSLGTFHMGTGESRVALLAATGDSGRSVLIDSLVFVPRVDRSPPDARIVSTNIQQDGVLVRWSGTDDASGVASFDVQVRRVRDGGWSDWKLHAVGLDGLFVPPGPGTYGFRIRARDWLGNEQIWREQDDATVTIE